MKTFDDIVDEVLSKIGTDQKQFTIDVSGIDNLDRNAIIDTIEDFGYNVDTSYGSDEISVTAS